jgi:hypothetical protein
MAASFEAQTAKRDADRDVGKQVKSTWVKGNLRIRIESPRVAS